MKKRNMVKIALILLLWAVSLPSLNCYAQENKEKAKEKSAVSVTKTIQGEISGIAKDSISIVYQRDVEKGIEYEIVLLLDEKNVQLVHKSNLKQFKAGDLVEVQYEEITEEYKEGQKSKRSAKMIRFIKPATK
ncbi:MAG: hypothetical protein KKH34_11285 [Candidatus Omnitrophica bacterium]|nr:hypothetical protein [Candidatus Omnitrophota bacterium]